MTKNIGGGRALRVCDLCGGVDDHPRHVIAGQLTGHFERPPAGVIAQVAANAPEDQRDRLIDALLDTGTSDRHMDCCREAGCPAGSCNQVTAGAEDKRGAQLLKHLTDGSN
jgi:hypothetical protein